MCRHVELTANGLTTKHVIRAVAGLDFPVLKTKNRDDDHERKRKGHDVNRVLVRQPTPTTRCTMLPLERNQMLR